MSQLTLDDARRLLDGEDLMPVVQASLLEAKQIVGACLEGGVPALLGRDAECGKGCSPKVMVLARPDDVGRVQSILRQRWVALLSSVDADVAHAGVWQEVDDDGEPPCPACGSRGALVAGACPECGLQLG